MNRTVRRSLHGWQDRALSRRVRPVQRTAASPQGYVSQVCPPWPASRSE